MRPSIEADIEKSHIDRTMSHMITTLVGKSKNDVTNRYGYQSSGELGRAHDICVVTRCLDRSPSAAIHRVSVAY